ncbi:MAG: twin-arginine translocase TatA/TatE family subunit [Chloroflexota bacterium]
MFGKLGLPELIIIVVIILIVFGAGRLPEVGGAIGKSIRAFREGQRGAGDDKKEPKPKS